MQYKFIINDMLYILELHLFVSELHQTSILDYMTIYYYLYEIVVKEK